jgi:hypothetical protein
MYSTYQLLYIYSIPPNDGLQICPKYVEVDWRNKLSINSESSWFLLHSYTEMRGQQNMKSEGRFCYFRLYNEFRRSRQFRLTFASGASVSSKLPCTRDTGLEIKSEISVCTCCSFCIRKHSVVTLRADVWRASVGTPTARLTVRLSLVFCS